MHCSEKGDLYRPFLTYVRARVCVCVCVAMYKNKENFNLEICIPNFRAALYFAVLTVHPQPPPYLSYAPALLIKKPANPNS